MVGNRLRNCFVSAREGTREINRVRALGRNLGPDDAVLIYPEGTLFTPSRRERVLARLRGRTDDSEQQAATLQHVLPPRLGGALALLDEAAGADAVFVAHTGLEPSTHYQSLADGSLVGTVIRVSAWRVPAAAIPGGREEREAWLLDQWKRVDAWIAEHGVHRGR
jgi:hypothetical protein